MRWVNFLFSIKRAAKEKTAEEWRDVFTQKDPLVFAQGILGKKLFFYFKQLAGGNSKLRAILREGFLETVQVF